MSSIYLHFQRIKEIVDWSWTLALLCLFGYLTLGQIAQLYYAMVFLGGVAASFGLFYDFSCQKLGELDSLTPFELQKANASAVQAETLLDRFAQRNPSFVNGSPKFSQVRREVRDFKSGTYNKFQEIARRQRASGDSTPSPSHPKSSSFKQTHRPADPSSGSASSQHKATGQGISQPPKKPTPNQQSAYRMPSRKTSPKPSLRLAKEAKLSESQYKAISNPGDYELVSGYPRKNGTWVNAYYRRKRRR